MRDIIVIDEGYKALDSFYVNVCSALEEQISSYIRILSSVPGDAMMGKAAQNVSDLAEIASGFSGVISDIGECMSLQLQNYLAGIEGADDYLYNG